MTQSYDKTPTSIEKSKKQLDNIKNATKNLDNCGPTYDDQLE